MSSSHVGHHFSSLRRRDAFGRRLLGQIARGVMWTLAAAMLLAGATAGAQASYSGVARIVAVGDVHGDFEQFVTVLRQAGVIDQRNRWIGKTTHLVQTGDVLDRGPDSRKVLELIMALEPQAAKAGGRVHALIGNHEVMNVVGDLRYVSPGEYAAFRTSKSKQLQDRAWKVLGDSSRRNDSVYHAQWLLEHPLGWVEQRMAFEGNGRYATWIRGHDAVVRINDWLFLHGGIGPKYVDSTIASLNAGVRRALDPTALAPEGNIAEDPDGPLWYRGLATGDEHELLPLVDRVLAKFGVQHVAIGHTVTPGTIWPRFDGKVVGIDVGLSAAYGGPPACLIVEDGKAFALHRGTRLALPLGGDLLAYLEAAAAIDPPDSRLRKYLAEQKAAR